MGNTLSSAISIAISKEQEAYDFYMDLYNKVEDKEAKSTLKYIAQEEAKLKDSAYQKAGAQGIANGVLEYLRWSTTVYTRE